MQLRHLSAYKFETISEYRIFKKEVRQIESEIKEESIGGSSKEVTPSCKATKQEKKEASRTEQQLDKISSMMQQLNTRMEELEQKQNASGDVEEQVHSHQQTFKQDTFHSQPPGNSHPQASYNQSQYYDNAPQQPRQFRPTGWRGPKHFRGPRPMPRGQGPFVGQGRGQYSYRPTRPIGLNQFRPDFRTCWTCGDVGHLSRDCHLN